MRYFKLIALLLSLFFYQASSQEAQYPITNYKTKDYGKDFHPTNMSVIQDQRGIIYIANGFKLLEFDGSSWNSYPINKEAWILSLAVDSSGIIYAGSQNEFGLFEPESNGNLRYRSLADSLDLQDLDFTNVWKVHAFSEGVVFQSEEKLFIYNNGKIKVINPETSFHNSFIVNDKLYVRQREKGLMEWKDDKLVLINDNQILKKSGVFVMLPFGPDSKILTGTRENGFYIFEPEDNSFRKFITDDDLLKKAVITGGVITDGGTIALSTQQNGVILIDSAGKIKAIIDKSNGLADNDVKQIKADRDGNLWLALNNGISRIEISSPLSMITEKSGLTGSINSIVRYKGLLYAGTTTGLFVSHKTDKHEFSFKAVHDLSVPVRSLIEADGHLVAGTDAGIFEIESEVRKTGSDATFTLFYSPEIKILFSGGPKGLRAYKNEGSFKKIEPLRIEGEDIIGIAAEINPTGATPEFWLGTRYNGVVRMKLNSDLTFTTESYNTADGMPEGPVMPVILNSATIFETIRGLYSFTNENIVKESVPDSLKNNKDFSKGYFSPLSNSDFTGKSISFLTENDNKIWMCANNTIGYLDKKNKMTLVSHPFNGIEAGKINFIYPEADGICWAGTADGLIRYDENTGKDYLKDYPCLIRKVTLLNNDSLVFLGTNFKSEHDKLKIISNQASDQVFSFPYSNNSVRLDFSTSFYEYRDKILYSSQLEGGSSSKWSQWTKDNYQEYTNLNEGNYKFRVKAKNIYGKESTVSEYSFVILPPWYRSLPAYISYFIISLVLLWLFARLYSYRLKRENIRLEGIINERTAEVVRQKDEIISKNNVLEHQKKEIEDSIRYASRIQTAVIPSENACMQIIPGSFVLFKPLNIVSGDFYWISRNGNKIIYTAADCTGHGVPGAFMSMLGVAFLNEIVNKDNVTVPDLILNNLRGKVIQALQQQGVAGEARDGMDIAIVSIDTVENKLVYAGAYNSLIMLREGQLTEISGDKMPVGIYENMNYFRKHEIDIRKGDVFYMFSDGYEDQFGGPEGKKFKAKRLKQMLMEIHHQPMKIQKEILEKTFEEWRGDLPQVDDVVVIGLTIG